MLWLDLEAEALFVTQWGGFEGSTQRLPARVGADRVTPAAPHEGDEVRARARRRRRRQPRQRAASAR